MFVLIRSDLVTYITKLEIGTKKTGLGGLTGNKGGIAVRFDYHDTSFVFITAHFAAGIIFFVGSSFLGQSNVDDRNRDYRTMTDGLVFRGKTIDDHTYVFWCGDFNYRMDLTNMDVNTSIL